MDGDTTEVIRDLTPVAWLWGWPDPSLACDPPLPGSPTGQLFNIQQPCHTLGRGGAQFCEVPHPLHSPQSSAPLALGGDVSPVKGILAC